MSYFELVGQETSEGQSPRGRQIWRITDVDDATTARAIAWAAAPVVFDGLLKQDAHIREIGGGQWDVEVTYGVLGSPEPDNISWSFDIGTSSLHITQALEHVNTYDMYGGLFAGHKGAIGVNRSGNSLNVEGCDIVIPVFTWEETHNLPAGTVASYAWIQTMEGLVGHINDAPFRIWAKGELLLLGVSGSHASLVEKCSPITFKFASSRTKTDLTIGDITGITKEGHHWLWIEYQEYEDEAAGLQTKRPWAVHVERVYEYADFGDLGIGDPWS